MILWILLMKHRLSYMKIIVKFCWTFKCWTSMTSWFYGVILYTPVAILLSSHCLRLSVKISKTPRAALFIIRNYCCEWYQAGVFTVSTKLVASWRASHMRVFKNFTCFMVYHRLGNVCLRVILMHKSAFIDSIGCKGRFRTELNLLVYHL